MRPKADPISLSSQASLLDDPQPRLTDFIHLRHPLVVMADRMDWDTFETYWTTQFSRAGGPKASPARLVAGLLMLKHMHGLSDEGLIEAWGQSIRITSTFVDRSIFNMNHQLILTLGDGHTLDDGIQQAETITGVAVKTAAVDLGYRGKHSTGAEIIHRGKKLSKGQKKRLRRRSMLEAMIGHMKHDGLLDRCHLKGLLGDAIHALLCGIGHNQRLLYNFWAEKLSRLLFVLLKVLQTSLIWVQRAVGEYQLT